MDGGLDEDEASTEDPTKHRTDGVRRSLSLFGRMNHFDLATLIRSSSLTSRRVSANPEGRPETRRRSRKVALDYVKQEMDDKRAAKAEGILNLISHSRSRSGSRSKGDEEPVVDVPVLTDAHKPPQRLHSRPISAATTNTASTVTPRKRAAAPSRIPIASVKEEEPPQQPPKKNFHIFGIPLPSPKKSSFASRPTSPSEQPPVPVRRKNSPSPRRAAAASPTPKSTAKLAKSKPVIGQGPPPPPSSKLDNFSKFFVGTGMRVSSNPERPRPVSPTAPRPSTATTPSKIPTPKHQHPPVSQKPGPHISPSTIVAEPATPKPALKQPSRKYMSEVGNTARVQEPVTPTPAPRVPSSSVSAVGASTPRPRVSGTSVVSGAASPTRIRSSISTPRASVLSPRASATGSTLAPPAVPRVRANSTGATRSAIGVSSRASAATTTTTSSLSTRERRTSTDSSSHAYHAYQPGARLGGIEEWRGKGGVEEADGDNNAIATTASENGNINGRRHVTAIRTPTTTAFAMTTGTATATAPRSTIGIASGRKHGSFDFERPGWGARAAAASSLGVGPRTKREPIRGASADRGTSAGWRASGLRGSMHQRLQHTVVCGSFHLPHRHQSLNSSRTTPARRRPPLRRRATSLRARAVGGAVRASASVRG
ncbi:hypothetical protein B0H13DRAFT_1001809 [Mycena leptocephala]|nr:hypothetical protein B0H13DRAFT_1001809 [Mycena leptocephala]